MIITLCNAFYQTDEQGINHIYVMDYEITEQKFIGDLGGIWNYTKRTQHDIGIMKADCTKTGNFVLGM